MLYKYKKIFTKMSYRSHKNIESVIMIIPCLTIWIVRYISKQMLVSFGQHEWQT